MTNEKLIDIPCNSCLHSKVCVARDKMLETEVTTTHPFFTVDIKCAEYRPLSPSLTRRSVDENINTKKAD